MSDVSQALLDSPIMRQFARCDERADDLERLRLARLATDAIRDARDDESVLIWFERAGEYGRMVDRYAAKWGMSGFYSPFSEADTAYIASDVKPNWNPGRDREVRP